MSTFPGSPRILKGAVVAYTLPALLPKVIVFQYNPEQVTRSLSPRTAEAGAGGGRGEANRTDGPPDETITLSVEIDAADQLELPDDNATTVEVGLHPVLAALEGLLYPPFPVVVANQVLANLGGSFIQGEPVPLTLLVWGPARVLPVRVQSLSITEQAFDTRLNPINAKADLGLKVLTYRDLQLTDPAYWVYMASFTQKEVMAAINLGQGTGALGRALPF
ncbi:MAG TPA: hypothetical protein PKA13_11715 [Geminicoccaceae bacterium]|nr:hypothetical protein [Geminicoccus sp.]HMU50433.1 hypothetical protein [Geminicoccaceae bacterium]